MKKLISFSLAALTALTASCGSTGSVTDTTAAPTDETTPVETENSRFDELGAKDFSGRTFTILDANDHPEMHVNMPGDTLNGDIVNDALYNRDSFIADKYKAEIKYEQITLGSEGRAAMKNCVLAGDDAYQLIITPLVGGNSLASLATEGLLASLSDSDYLSLDKNWWSYLMYDHLRINDKMYFTTGDISPTMYQMPACYFLNTSLCEDYGITTDFCQLVRDGKWTLAQSYEITKDLNKDLNDDGVMHASDDFFGFIHQKLGGLVTNGLLTTAGIELASITPDGKSLRVDIANERNVSIIENIKKFIVDIQYVEQNDVINKAFKENRALALYHYAESASVHLRDMEKDYLILPMPKADEEQTDYHSFVNPWADAFVAIPKTADLEFAGFMTEALGYYSYVNVRPLAYEITYNQKASRNENSAEMLGIIFDTLYTDFNCIYDFAGVTTALTSVIKGSALSTEMAKIQTASEEAIATFIENWG